MEFRKDCYVDITFRGWGKCTDFSKPPHYKINVFRGVGRRSDWRRNTGTKIIAANLLWSLL